MVDVLRKRVADCGFEDRLTVIQKDALKTQFPPFDVVVANIPYQISSPLVIKLVYGKIQFRSATLLLQKEFARRLLANPGNSEYNRLAVNVKLVADVEFAMDVSKRDFLPVPKVDSSVVIIHPKTELPNVNLAEWWAFTRTCFGKKNKTLGATFKQKRKVMEILETSTLAGLRQDGTINEDDGISGVSIEGSDMDEKGKSEEESLSSSEPEGEMNSFKEKIVGILRAEGFEDKRPSKLSNEELLHLLAVLNHAGVYFHNQAKSQ
ncbi:rRNA adenine N(6)-methyltransferase, partial [Psidium guajava]